MQLVTALKKNPLLYWEMLKSEPKAFCGCSVVHTGILSPWLNGVVEGVPEDVDQLVAYLKGLHVPFSWWSQVASEPASLREELEARGLVFAGVCTGMTRGLEPLHTEPLPNFVIQRVKSADQLKDFLNVLVEVYEAPREVIEPSVELFLRAGLEAPRNHFLGILGGEPVSAVSLYVDSERVASVYNMGTRQAFRKRGYASQLLAHALDVVASEERAESSALIATPEGVGLYSRLGYESCEPFHLYMYL